MNSKHPTFDKVDSVVYKVIRVISDVSAAFLFGIMMLAVGFPAA